MSDKVENPFGRKLKVLVVPSDRTGVGYFRSTNPHIILQRNYPDDFHVDIEYEPKLDNEEWLKKYDIIHYHRGLGATDKMPDLLNRLEELGILTFMDVDDHWAPGMHHPAYHMIKQSGMDKQIANNIRNSKNIITTTSIFKSEMAKMNDSIFVLPNAINPEDRQFKPKPTESDRIRIGWLGGSSHLHDIKLLKGMVSKLKNDGLLDKIQFVLCGYDLRGMITEMNQQTGQQTQRPIKPQESVWYDYEKIFTNDFKSISPEYKEWLHKFDKSDYENVANEPYRRVWTKPIQSYATNYNHFDISLAPLETNMFNKVKSQLKVIEAGFHKKALIAQDYGPYTIDLKNAKISGGGFDDEANSLMVDNSKNHKQWYQHIKYLIQNPEKIEVLANNLHETVKDTYSIDAVSELRRDLYLTELSKLRSVGEIVKV